MKPFYRGLGIRLSPFIVCLLLFAFLFPLPVSFASPQVPPLKPTLVPEGQLAPYILKVGTVPTFPDATAESSYLSDLTLLAHELRGAAVPYWGTVVLAHGAGADGYFWLMVSPRATLNSSVVQAIEGKVDSAGKSLNSFATGVPLKFAIWGGLSLDSRTSEWRPIISGVQARDYPQTSCQITSTLGYTAEVGSTKGYVVSGHLGANTACTTEAKTPVGLTIYQPDTSCSNPPCSTGTVSSYGGIDADVAWVPYSNVKPQVYVSNIGYSISFYEDAAVGNSIELSGLASDIQTGTVSYVCMDLSGYFGGTLYCQTLATYNSASGDSGAPVFIEVSGYGRGIVGIHSGRATVGGVNYAFYSPQSGVKNDVGAVAYTIYG